MSTELRLKNLETKMDIIILILQRIENKLNEVEKSCGGMDEHINFVESVYSTVRSPLDFIVNKTKYLMNNSQSSEALPLLDAKMD